MINFLEMTAQREVAGSWISQRTIVNVNCIQCIGIDAKSGKTMIGLSDGAVFAVVEDYDTVKEALGAFDITTASLASKK